MTGSSGTTIGTPEYMSPEQVQGHKLDGRSDLFSLGMTVYQLLRGELPFEAPSLTGLMFKIANEPQPDVTFLRPDIPPTVKVVVDKILNPKVAELAGVAQHAIAPFTVAATVVDGLPPNLSTRAEEGTIAASFWRSATLPAPTTSGTVPNALLSTTRTRSPPMLVWTIWRSV